MADNPNTDPVQEKVKEQSKTPKIISFFKRYSWSILFVALWIVAFLIFTSLPQGPSGKGSSSSSGDNLGIFPSLLLSSAVVFILYILFSIGARIRHKLDGWKESEEWKKESTVLNDKEKDLIDIITLINEQRLRELKEKIPNVEKNLAEFKFQESLLQQDRDAEPDQKKQEILDQKLLSKQKQITREINTLSELKNEINILYTARAVPLFLEIKHLVYKAKINEHRYNIATKRHRQWWYFLQGFSLVVSFIIPIAGGLGAADPGVTTILDNHIKEFFTKSKSIPSDTVFVALKDSVRLLREVDMGLKADINKLDTILKANRKQSVQSVGKKNLTASTTETVIKEQKPNKPEVPPSRTIPNTKDIITLLLIILPTLSAVSANIIIRFRLSDLWLIRDKGRIDYRKLAEEGRQKMLMAKNAQDLVEIHSYLNDSMRKIEDTQQVRFFSVPDPSQNQDGKTST
ncbi:MAG: hypothetical protein H9535_08230 [Ignavibacteria bacterium]|nr:hypothetical protein [Ignavibacteria bacterium]